MLNVVKLGIAHNTTALCAIRIGLGRDALAQPQARLGIW